MSQFAIQVEHLSKSYRIRQVERAGYTALRDVISERTCRFFDRLAKGKNPLQGEDYHEEFWALDDVSFNVEHGEVLGIIGRNGAGKSTLLKLLSRITEPDKGKITLNGRVASLLEVGTGFHPELTGRENIYLSGAILGMRREEIKKHFDEIVDFAGVEKFLDTPVKRYSSGMYVRLGFAVAAHLETEILLVDEVLAVGDMEFQRKCIGKMGEVSTTGVTVLIVSHNLGTISRLCHQGLLIYEGKLVLHAPVQTTIEEYVQLRKDSIKLSPYFFIKLDKEPVNLYQFDEPIEMQIELRDLLLSNLISLSLSNSMGERILVSERELNYKTDNSIIIVVPGSVLIEGKYFVSVSFKNPKTFEIASSNENVASFEIVSRPTRYGQYNLQRLGFVNDILNWSIDL